MIFFNLVDTSQIFINRMNNDFGIKINIDQFEVNGKLKCICSYRVVRHVFSIKCLYTNCIHELETSNHELVLESDALNMDYLSAI